MQGKGRLRYVTLYVLYSDAYVTLLLHFILYFWLRRVGHKATLAVNVAF